MFIKNNYNYNNNIYIYILRNIHILTNIFNKYLLNSNIIINNFDVAWTTYELRMAQDFHSPQYAWGLFLEHEKG